MGCFDRKRWGYLQPGSMPLNSNMSTKSKNVILNPILLTCKEKGSDIPVSEPSPLV